MTCDIFYCLCINFHDQEICGILLKHKAFINAKSRVGFTALHLAATKGYTKLCLFLIQEHGASVDAVTLVSYILVEGDDHYL